MTKHEEIRRKSLLKKLVSNAKAIIAEKISMPLGSLEMEKIIYWINQIKPITELDLKVFADFNNQTNDYPIGEDRTNYNKEFLAKLDVKLDDVTLYFKDQIREKCLEIIKKYSLEES